MRAHVSKGVYEECHARGCTDHAGRGDLCGFPCRVRRFRQCGETSRHHLVPPSPDAAGTSDQRFPDIVGAEVTEDASGIYTFAITVSSPYDTARRYADGWRIIGPDWQVYGEHMLTHDHASEQPFTHTQSGVTIPDGVATVTIEVRDKANGYGGATTQVALPAN